MKLFLCLFTALVCLSSGLTALTPRAAHNEHKRAYAHDICICEDEGVTLHIATYLEGKIVTILTGPDAGYQYIEEGGVIKDHSKDVDWHHHSFTHRYLGCKVISYTKDHGKAHGQKVVYRKKAKD